MINLNVPKAFTAGDTVTWLDQGLSGINVDTGEAISFLPTAFTLSWAFRGAGTINAVAVTAGNAFKTTIPSSVTVALAVGLYSWQAYLTDLSGDRSTIGTGQTKVKANLAAQTAVFDGRSEAEQMLALVNAAIKARTEGNAVEEYQIAGRNLKYSPITELLMLRQRLQKEVVAQVQAAQMAQGINPRRHYVRFARPL